MDLQTFLTAVDFTGSAFGSSGTQTIPAAPTTLVATADSDSIGLTWTRVGTYDNVLIDRKSTGEYSQLASIPTAASYDDTTAVPGVTYTYRVRGQRNGYSGPYSNESSDTVSTQSVARTADFEENDTVFLVKTNTAKGLNGGNFTLTCFVRPTFLAEVGTLRGICSKGAVQSPNSGWAHALYYSRVSNKVVFLLSDGTTLFSVSSAGALTNNEWAFIAVYYNSGTKVLSMSIDRAAATTASSVEAPNELSEDLRIGNVKATAGFKSWQGQISLMGFYGDELSSGDLDEIYNSGLGKTYSNLSSGIQDVAESYWQLDELSDGTGSVTRVDSGTSPVDMPDPNTVPSSTEVPS